MRFAFSTPCNVLCCLSPSLCHAACSISFGQAAEVSQAAPYRHATPCPVNWGMQITEAEAPNVPVQNQCYDGEPSCPPVSPVTPPPHPIGHLEGHLAGRRRVTWCWVSPISPPAPPGPHSRVARRRLPLLRGGGLPGKQADRAPCTTCTPVCTAYHESTKSKQQHNSPEVDSVLPYCRV